jgi:hypothetical protein
MPITWLKAYSRQLAPKFFHLREQTTHFFVYSPDLYRSYPALQLFRVAQTFSDKFVLVQIFYKSALKVKIGQKLLVASVLGEIPSSAGSLKRLAAAAGSWLALRGRLELRLARGGWLRASYERRPAPNRVIGRWPNALRWLSSFAYG